MSIDLEPGDHRIGKEPPVLSVAFRIGGGGAFDPEELSRRFGIQPTKAWRVGDLRRPNQPPSSSGPARHKRAGWMLRVGPRPAAETGPLCLELLGLASPAPPAMIKETLRELELEGWVHVGITRRDEEFTPAIDVPLEFIEWMAAVGIDLAVDIIY